MRVNDNKINNIRTTATNLTAGPQDDYIGVTDTSAVRTITLPPVASVEDGHIIIIHDESGASGTNNIVVDGDGTETIDGAATFSLTANNETVRVLKRGSGWFTV